MKEKIKKPFPLMPGDPHAPGQVYKTFFSPEDREKKMGSFDPMQYFEEISVRFESNLAVKVGNKAVNFGEFNRKANQIANKLISLNAAQQTALPLLIEPSPNFVIGQMAALKAGMFFVSLDTYFPKKRLVDTILDSEAKWVLVSEDQLEIAHSLGLNNITFVNIDEIEPGFDDSFPNIPLSPDSITHLSYTSGTTGKPKGYTSLAERFYQSLFKEHDWLNLGPEDRVARFGSLATGGGGGALKSLENLSTGASVHLYDIRKIGISPFKEWIMVEGITVYSSSATIFRRFMETLSDGDCLESIRALTLGGERILISDIEFFKKFFPINSKLRVGYSGTEFSQIAKFLVSHETTIEGSIVPAGYINPQKKVYLWDQNDQDVPAGEVGEVIVKFSQRIYRYWNRPELNKEKFLPDPDGEPGQLFRTGDLARILPNGMLVHMGRKDEQVKIRGNRIEIGEIEAVLIKSLDLKEIAVRAWENDRREPYLAAYMVSKDGVNLKSDDIRKIIKNYLPVYMIPMYFIYLDKLPLTPGFKLDRGNLPCPEFTRPALSQPFIAPRNSVEENLVNVWTEIIGIDKIGIDDGFFDLGGDSLMAARLFVEIEELFNKKLPFSMIVTASTIREQAQILQSKEFDVSWSPLVPIRTGGSKKPIYCIAGAGGNPIRFHRFAEIVDQDQPLYFLQPKGISGRERPYRSMEKIANNFIASIKKVQSKGPYHFLGESSGGLIAYEMAQQLVNQGELVGILAMLDTKGPKSRSNKPNKRYVKNNYLLYYSGLFRKHFQNLFTGGWKGFRFYVSYYIKLSKHKIENIINKHSYNSKNNYGNIPPEIKAVEAANRQAVRAYQPKPYSGQVIMFCATLEGTKNKAQYNNGWDEVGISEFINYDINCFHGNILFEPHVSIITKLLKKHLDLATDQSSEKN